MSLVEDYYRSIFKKESSNKGPDKKFSTEMRPDPSLEKLFYGTDKTHDGNVALGREDWLKKVDPKTLELLVNLRKGDPATYSMSKITYILSFLDKLKTNNNFDIKFVSGRAPKSRSELFPPLIKKKIISDIASGNLRGYDEEYFAKIVQGGKEALGGILAISKHVNELKLSQQKNVQERLATFRERSESKQELLTTECPLLIIETHMDRSESKSARPLETIGDKLPPEIDRRMLRIGYQEGVSVNQGQPVDNGEAKYIEIVDRSGEIGDDVLGNVIKNGEKANLILTGGNLRGCLSSSLESVVRVIEKNTPSQVDIHLPLDKIYDNGGYDGLTKFPADLLKTKGKLNLEVYKDGNVVYVGTDDAGKVRVRLYQWSRTEILLGKFNDTVAIKNIKSDILEEKVV